MAALFGLTTLVSVEFASGQPGATPDTVHYRDRKKDNQVVTVRGETKESAKGIEVLINGKVAVTVSPADVVRVDYGRLPGLADADRLGAITLENREIRDGKDLAAARTAYTDMLKAAGGSDQRTRKFLEYREAMWTARVADTKTGADFQTEAKRAIDKLSAFIRAYPKSWEVWPATTVTARLQNEIGKANDAAATWGALGKNPDLPADLRYLARLGELETLLQSNPLAAQPAADDLAKDRGFPATGPLRDKLTVFQAVLKAPPPKEGPKPAEVKSVEDVVAKTTDPGVRAVAHNALGEYYLANNRPREAMWEFLWVETVYNQDKDELVKAVARLAHVFELLGDKERADQYRDKLPRVKAA
jgi:hypothetical protein